jgi:HSP20 family protein
MAKKIEKEPTAAKKAPDVSAEPQLSRIEALRREVDRLFDMVHPADWRLPLIGSSGFEVRLPRWTDWQIAPAINMIETEEAFTITAELPGMVESDVEVKATSEMLTIRGEKSKKREVDEGDYHLSERRFGKFQRSFRLPEGVSIDKIDANMTNGILTVTLPKTPEAKKAERTIQVRKD